MKKQLVRPHILILLLVLAVAAFFRFYQLDQTPPGLFPDEATHALDALEVLGGQITLYSPDEGSSGTLWRYLLALHFALFGSSIITLRIFASGVGVASVGAAYLLVRELALAPSGINDERVAARQWNETIAVVAALLLAVSYWHVDLSRVAFSAVLMLLIQDVTFFCLWRAVASGRRIWFVLFGLGVGLLTYNYLPGKLTPIMLLLFFLLNWVIAQREALAVKFWRSLLVSTGLALVLALPIVLFGLLNYNMLLVRAAVPTAGAVAPLSPLQGIVANLNVFGLWPTFWLAGRWEAFFLGPVLTVCFVAGIGVSLTRLKRPVYLFLLVWWVVMLLPGALAPEGAIPHTRRTISTATATYALASVGLATLLYGVFLLAGRVPFLRGSSYDRRSKTIPLMLMLLVGFVLVTWTGFETFRRYFIEWGPSDEAKLAFHVYDMELADLMAQESGAETVYLLPLDSAAGIVNPLLDSITFVYRGQASYDFLPDDEQTMLLRLSELAEDKEIIRLLRWNVTKHTGADPKNVAHYYLEKWGHQKGTESHRYFDIDTYELYDVADAFTPPEFNPTRVDFEGQMLLTGHAFGAEYLPNSALLGVEQIDTPTVPAGNLLWVESKWRKTGDIPANYQLGIWLEDQAGHAVGRIDGPLMNNLWHQGTSQWPIGAEERAYYLLKVDPATLPGRYRLKTVLYTVDNLSTGLTGRRLAPDTPGIGADLAVVLGEVLVQSPLNPPDPAELSIPQRLDWELGPGLRLLGFDPGFAGELRPGDLATLSLWWQATQPLSPDLEVAVGVSNDQQSWTLNGPEPLGGNDYPTQSWPTGTVVRTFVDVRLPADLETGQYNLGLRLLEAAKDSSFADWLLGQVQVKGRPRSFDSPSQMHKVGANFGNQITLLGYDIDLPEAEASGVVRLVLHWQAQTEMQTPYKVFVHLLDDTGQIITQVDREPQAGEAPTTGWLEGEVVSDVLDLPPDERLTIVSQIAIGLYDPQNGDRLPLLDRAGQVEDTQVTVDMNDILGN